MTSKNHFEINLPLETIHLRRRHFWEGGVKYHVNVLNGWFFLDNVILTIKENYFM